MMICGAKLLWRIQCENKKIPTPPNPLNWLPQPLHTSSLFFSRPKKGWKICHKEEYKKGLVGWYKEEYKKGQRSLELDGGGGKRK